MPKKGLKSLKSCSPSCCRRKSNTLSDEEFDDLQTVALTNRVVEETETEGLIRHPHVSTGSLSEASPVNISQRAHPESPNQQKLSIGNRAKAYLPEEVNLSSDEETKDLNQKSVHFAVCHDPDAKDTREQYRSTPVKDKQHKSQQYNEEHFFMSSSDSENIVKISLADLKTYVHEYVRKIVESALTAVAREDYIGRNEDIASPSGVKITEKEGDDDTDDGIDVSSSDETDLISSMVDDMLADITKVMTSKQQNPETPTDGSVSDVSTVTSESVRQIESLSSLEWDGYEPLLREEPSFSDVATRIPATSTTS
ncbi:uncharacterized protein LOC120332234 [Styela clava]